MVATLMRSVEEKKRLRRMSKKRTNSDEVEFDFLKRARRRLDDFQIGKSRNMYDETKYLEKVGVDEVKSCYRAFFEGTSNKALKMDICGVCAREVFVNNLGEEIQVFYVQDIPNVDRLRCKRPHQAHFLVDGKLLTKEGTHETDKGLMVNVCRQCLLALQSSSGKPPMFSLTNNMWIGDVPSVLSSLTFPEQLLVSLVYPRVYVFKLYPKKGYAGDPSKLQRAMRGTVSTFKLDMTGIISMIEGDLMPRAPSLLASLISLTYIGVGALPRDWLRHFFRVRRYHVWLALCWLKKNNVKYYGNIKINTDRLHALPIDDIPSELLSIMRQMEETGIIDCESAGQLNHKDMMAEESFGMFVAFIWI
jgi:hypothetical protein